PPLQLVDGRVLARLLVADLGRGHRREHLLGRLGRRVRAEIDHRSERTAGRCVVAADSASPGCPEAAAAHTSRAAPTPATPPPKGWGNSPATLTGDGTGRSVARPCRGCTDCVSLRSCRRAAACLVV